MIELRRAESHGQTRFNGVSAQHHFCYGPYQSPERINWGRLRTFNRLEIAPGGARPPNFLGGMEVLLIAETGATVVRCGGSDTVVGGAGDDLLYGDGAAIAEDGAAGADRFVFASGDGNDTIADFGGGDLLDVTGYGLSFASLDSDTDGSLTDADDLVALDGGDLVVDLGAAAGGAAVSDTIRLTGVSQLTETAFVF